jgi:hypothetical protein
VSSQQAADIANRIAADFGSVEPIEAVEWSGRISRPDKNGMRTVKITKFSEMHTMHLVNTIKRQIASARAACGLTQSPIEELAVRCAYAPQVFSLFQEAMRRGDILIWNLSMHAALAHAFKESGRLEHYKAANRLIVAAKTLSVLTEGQNGS